MSRTNLSNLVSSQFPAFIRDDYSKFIAFVEAYYEYMHQNYSDDILELMDVDSTVDELVEQFKKQLNLSVSNIQNIDERFLLRHLRECYASKGSEASFKLFFKLLFDSDIEFEYPSRSMLIASGGNWIKNVSIIVNVNTGNINSMLGQRIAVKSLDKVIKITIEDIIDRGNGYYEMFIDRSYYGTINYNDIVYDPNSDFTATVRPSVSKISMYSSGRDFRVGDIYELKSGSGSGTFIKVTQVGGTYTQTFNGSSTSVVSVASDTLTFDSHNFITGDAVVYSSGSGTAISGLTSGNTYYVIVVNTTTIKLATSYLNALASTAINLVVVGTGTSHSLYLESLNALQRFDIIQHGTGYSADFIINVIPIAKKDLALPSSFSSGGSSPSLTGTAADYVRTFNEQISFATSNYLDPTYWDPSYNNLGVFASYSSDQSVASSYPAILTVTVAGVAKYAGYFADNAGFISDNIYIQDSRYYQLYSYVLKVDKQLDEYSQLLKEYLHPSGLELFGEFEINNNISYTAISNTDKAFVWTVSTSYALNNVIYNNGNKYIATIAGTSASTGTGPSHTSGTATDGTVTWTYSAS